MLNDKPTVRVKSPLNVSIVSGTHNLPKAQVCSDTNLPTMPHVEWIVPFFVHKDIHIH